MVGKKLRLHAAEAGSVFAFDIKDPVAADLMHFTRNQVIGGIILLALLWAVILFRVLSSGT